ncbi:stage III sporulation protein AH [Marininema halotolerans]|uniref:Stage III sporulation protein AH n=2 Tax=Marininema halotolerans TaxID=1155944 RepID=A0A1I6TVF2_9BACL|nr:stage III sporulation protein AH [Marininema halotolerans]
MNMNKQTVWLVTMLTLMVVLSAYYIVTGPVEPADKTAMEDKVLDTTKVDVKTKELEKGDKEQKTAGKESNSKVKETTTKGENDYFVGYQLQRNTLRSKLTEEYMKVLTDPQVSKKKANEAEAKINELTKVDKTESVMEDLIRNEGFQDAVVIENANKMVDVIVQSNKLTNAQVVKLIGMVKQQMDVPATKVSIAYKP